MQAALVVRLALAGAGDGGVWMLPSTSPFAPRCRRGKPPRAREHPRRGAGLDPGLSPFGWGSRGCRGTGPMGPAVNLGTSPAQAAPGSQVDLDAALSSVPTTG